MPKIALLSESTINEIAAGEVIDRPASVVRELVDNSVDAGASLITVDLEDGGHTMIRVADNGCGIDSEDLVMAFSRHATSKLKSLGDLNSLTTKGFRGEALSSIAAVSRISILTRTTEAPSGTQLQIEAGQSPVVTHKPANPGTIIDVSSLYFNIPARRKFLKSDKSETEKIKNWLIKYSLTHYDVQFKLVANGVTILDLNKKPDIFARAEQIYKGNFLAVSRKLSDFELKGFLSHPAEATSRGTNFTIFINNRMISDRAIIKAVKDGYGSLLKSFETPSGFLALSIPAELVDINVHPQKTEVRIANQNGVFGIVKETVRKSLSQLAADNEFNPAEETGPREPTLPKSGPNTDQFPMMLSDQVHYYNIDFGKNPASPNPQQVIPGAFLQNTAPLTVPAFNRAFRYSDLMFAGKVLGCYLICSTQEKLVIVDMHAAHERVNFYKIKTAFESRKIECQQLLLPYEFTAEAAFEEEIVEILRQFGFESERSGDNGGNDRNGVKIGIKTAPTYLSFSKLTVVLNELCEIIRDYFSEEPDDINQFIEVKQDMIIARLACHSSIRSGDYITKPEVAGLFSALDQTPVNYACPHGRPIVVEFTEKQVEQWFGRDR